VKSLSEFVTKKDEYAVYGEHVAHKMRNCRRNGIKISLVQYYINEIILNLDMGVYADSSMVPPNKCSHHRFYELSSPSTSCSNHPIPSPSPPYTCLTSDISYLSSSSSDLSLQEAPNLLVPVETHTQNNVHTNQESIQALLNNFSGQ
jgi:hypothetical protein